jgi:hypothetical protein
MFDEFCDCVEAQIATVHQKIIENQEDYRWI